MAHNPKEKVELKNLDLLPYPREVEVFGIAGNWQTPGLYLAQNIGGNPLVRLVGEKYYPDYLQVIIIIDDDPEELLDKIFSFEQNMRERFKRVNFDVRVRVISADEDIKDIKQDLFLHYERI